jgi:hypothetical protein
VFDVQDPFALGGLSLLGGLATGGVASRFGNVQSGTQYRDPQTGELVEAGRLRGLNVEAGDVGVGGGTIRNLRNVGGTTEDALSQRQGEITRLIDRTATNAQPTGIKAGTESKVVAKDLRTQYNTAKKNVAPLFDNARKLAGDQPIPITRAQAAIDQVLDQIPDTAETNIIMRNINRLQNLAEGGGTYKEIRDVSSNIGSELSRVSKGIPGGSYSPAQQSAIKGLYDALSEDVDAWAAPRQINGKPVYTPAGAAHERAMEQFRQTVAPFRQDQDIFRVVSSRTFGDDYDRAAANFVNKLTSNNETADLSMNLMSDKGQKAAQFKILNDARSAALGVDPKTPSIDQFNRSLNLGLVDNPTPQRTILARNPELLNEVSTTTGLLNTVRQGLDQTQQSPFLPYAGRAATGGLVGFLGSQAGLGPVGAGALGTGTAILAPQVTNLLTDAATSLPATRFILGQPNLGTAGATGLTAAQLGEIQRQSEIPRIELRNMAP